MNAQREIHNLLTTELAKIRTRNPRYSLRSFAKKIGIPVSALSEILNRKHKISKKRATKILQSLGVAPDLTVKILLGFRNTREESIDLESTYTELDTDQYYLISEWYYFAILSLSETKDFKSSASWIAKRLGISSDTVRLALDRMVKLNVLRIAPNGHFTATGLKFKTSTGIRNLALRKNHAQTLDLAKRSLETSPLEVCNFSSNTLALDPDKLPEAAEMIAEFRRSLCAFLERDEKKAVYRVAVQLFPLERDILNIQNMDPL